MPVTAVPELMVADEVTTIELSGDATGIVAASLTAFMPILPELIVTLAPAMTEMFPRSALYAKTP